MKLILLIIGLNVALLILASCENDLLEENLTSNILVYESFETNGLNWETHTARDSNITRDNTLQARSGDYAIKIEVFKSDPWIANGPRSEIYRPNGIDYWSEGDEVWIGGSILFPENYVDDPMQEIIWQIHGDETDPYVPFLIQVVNDDLVIKGKGFSEHVYQMKKGQWMDIVVHHSWSAKDNGVTQVFLDGESIINLNDISNMKPNTFLYWKFGIYKSGWKQQGDSLSTVDYRKIWFDEIRIGNSHSDYFEVSPK